METEAALINAYTTITSTEINAWTMYVVATFAASGFGYSSANADNFKMAIAATIGFIAFACGHYVIVCDLINQREAVLDALRGLIKKKVEAESLVETTPTSGLIETFSTSGLTESGAFLTHAVVGLCVVFLIMVHSLSKLMNKSRIK